MTEWRVSGGRQHRLRVAPPAQAVGRLEAVDVAHPGLEVAVRIGGRVHPHAPGPGAVLHHEGAVALGVDRLGMDVPAQAVGAGGVAQLLIDVDQAALVAAAPGEADEPHAEEALLLVEDHVGRSPGAAEGQVRRRQDRVRLVGAPAQPVGGLGVSQAHVGGARGGAVAEVPHAVAAFREDHRRVVELHPAPGLVRGHGREGGLVRPLPSKAVKGRGHGLPFIRPRPACGAAGRGGA